MSFIILKQTIWSNLISVYSDFDQYSRRAGATTESYLCLHLMTSLNKTSQTICPLSELAQFLSSDREKSGNLIANNLFSIHATFGMFHSQVQRPGARIDNSRQLSIWAPYCVIFVALWLHLMTSVTFALKSFINLT